MRSINLILTAVILCTASVAQADGLMINRVDSRNGAQSHTLGVVLPQIEVWGFGLSTSYPDIEIGRVWPVFKSRHAQVNGGGYLASWPNQGKDFILPWVDAHVQHGRFVFDAALSAYLPTNNGPFIVYSNEAWVGYAVTNRVKAGVATAFWEQDGFKTVPGVGPAVKWQIGKGQSLGLRYLLESDGHNAVRFQFNHSF